MDNRLKSRPHSCKYSVYLYEHGTHFVFPESVLKKALPFGADTLVNLSLIHIYRAIGDNGILVAGMDNHYRGIMFYGGTYGYCDQYMTDVKAFQSALPEVTVYSMVIPTSVDFYNPTEYKGYTELQKDKIDYICLLYTSRCV